MKALITDIVVNRVNTCKNSSYRTPLLGFSSAQDEIFSQFKSLIGENHLLPEDLLPGARSVVAFFLPYKKELISENRAGIHASRSWAEAYQNTNKLINDICKDLSVKLASHGIKTAWLLPTYEFDKQNLTAQWSHKHVAYACGLGSFGKNQLLITSKGCAGRFGTAVLDIELEPTPRSSRTHSCLTETGCKYCEKNCPVQAISSFGFDRHRCYGRCLENDALYPDLESVEVCGKCASGPCAVLE